MTENHVIVYFTLDAPTSDDFFERLLAECLGFGCNTMEDDGQELFSVVVFGPYPSRRDVSIESAAQILSEFEHANVDLEYGDLKFTFSKNTRSEAQPPGPHFSLLIWNTQFKHHPPEPESAVQERVHQFASLVEYVFEAANATFAYGRLGYISPEDHPSPAQLAAHDPGILGWLNAYTPELVDGFQPPLRDLPWHYYHELDAGGAVCVTTPTPIEFGECNEVAATIASVLGVEIASFR